METKVCVVGGGVSAGYIARTWVENDGLKQAGKLTIINERDTLPFERPALSKGYITNPDLKVDKFLTTAGTGGDLQDRKWYEEHGVSVLTETKVVNLDLKNRELQLQSVPDPNQKDTIKFDNLILATGCDARHLGCPGEELKGIVYLRESADADYLRESIEDCKGRGGKAVVVGGGYLGMEVGAGMRQRGLDVAMCYPGESLMTPFFPPDLAKFYEAYYIKEGVRLLRKTTAKAFLGDDSGHVRAVQLEDGGEVEGSLVLVAVGARPRVDQFKGMGLEMSDKTGGIIVDGYFRSSVPGVYAVGDISHYPLKFTGEETYERQEHVQHARESGQLSARHILDPVNTPEYDYLPYFYSREFDLAWKFYGDSKTKETHVVGNMDPWLVCVWRDEQQKLVGILVEGKGDDRFVRLMQRLARQRPTFNDKALQTFKAAAVADVPEAMKVLEALLPDEKK